MVGACRQNTRRKNCKEVFKNAVEEKRAILKPRKRWFDDVENDPKKTGVRGWRKMAKD
jgi:hypothetical protein